MIPYILVFIIVTILSFLANSEFKKNHKKIYIDINKIKYLIELKNIMKD